MNVNWQGGFPAISTQFYEGATVYYKSSARMLEDLIRDGIGEITTLDTIGENTSLSPEEKHNFIKHTVETFKGRILVLSGCTENTTEQILGRGSENLHMPRLPLIGEEWTYVEQVIAQALETRIDLDKYNID